MDTTMYLDSLEKVLSKRFPANRYHIGGYQEAAVCIQSCNNGWIVYNGERGNKYNVIECDTILMACMELIRKLTHRREDISAMENELVVQILDRNIA